jgi:hypothetical protein
MRKFIHIALYSYSFINADGGIAMFIKVDVSDEDSCLACGNAVKEA